MIPAEYERVTSEVVAGLRSSFPGNGFEITFGARNKVVGKSGYPHQIDVSLALNKLLLLVECKYLSRPVGVAEVLVLASRLADIAAAQPGIQCVALLASKRRPSRNAAKLANHFKIGLEVVQSAQEFGMRVGHAVHQGLADRIACTDFAEAEVRKKLSPQGP